MHLPLPASVMTVLCVAGTISASPVTSNSTTSAIPTSTTHSIPTGSLPATGPGAYHVYTIVLFAERMVRPLVSTLNSEPVARAVAADFERMHNLTDVSEAVPRLLVPPQPFDGDDLLDYVIWLMCCLLDCPADVWTGGIKRAAFPFSLDHHVFVTARADPPKFKRPVDRERAMALLRAWRDGTLPLGPVNVAGAAVDADIVTGFTGAYAGVVRLWREWFDRTQVRGVQGAVAFGVDRVVEGRGDALLEPREFTEGDARQVLLLATFILIEVLPWLLPLL